MALASRPPSTTDAATPEVLPVDTHGALPGTHAAAQDAPRLAAGTHASRAGTEDRGSFTHGICDDCGWSGPGRRARAAAARDAVRHLQTGCAGRVTSAAAHPDAAL
jgi:hypothetical protein